MQDLANLSLMDCGECDYMAVGIDAPPILHSYEYLVTYHIEDVRSLPGLGFLGMIIHHEFAPEVNIVEPHTGPPEVSGGSALLGVLAAIRLGYNKIVICGCPMEGPNPRHKGWDYNRFQGGWEKKAEVIKPFTRSMSGWTAKFLGKPTDEWLEGRERLERRKYPRVECNIPCEFILGD